jgi:hypothetical protein
MGHVLVRGIIWYDVVIGIYTREEIVNSRQEEDLLDRVSDVANPILYINMGIYQTKASPVHSVLAEGRCRSRNGNQLLIIFIIIPCKRTVVRCAILPLVRPGRCCNPSKPTKNAARALLLDDLDTVFKELAPI